MFLANLSKREKAFFYLMAAVISLSLVYNFVLKPLSVKWGRLNCQILKKEIALKRNIRYLKGKDRVKGIYLKYDEYLQERSSDEEEVAALLNKVEQEARASGIHIADIRPKPTQDLVFYKKYILEIACVGTMEKYIDFAYNLQKSAQLIRVEKLDLTSPDKDTPLLKARMLITKVQTGR